MANIAYDAMVTNEFDDERKEYVIRDMFPARPWLNYAWNSEYVSSFDQFGFGMSRFCDNDGYKKSVLAEGDNRLVFVKDNETGEYFAANRNYGDAPFDVFETRVGTGYSLITSEYLGLRTVFRLFVPPEGQCECWEICVTNTSGRDRDISLYPYVLTDTKLSPIDGYSKAGYNEELGGIYASHEGKDMPTEYSGVYFVSDKKPCAYETSDRRFRGVYSWIGRPEGLKSGRLSCKATCFEFCPAAVMQFNTKLSPSESIRLRFVLGASRSPEEAKSVCGALWKDGEFERSLEEVTASSEKFRSGIDIKTPDADINRMINIWLKRQMQLGMQWGRLYGKGFRDIMQDTTGFMSLAPEKARDRIIYSAGYQRFDGNPVRQWDPLIEKVFADGAVWLVYAVNAYLGETGDIDVLKEEIPYFDRDTKESLFEHCRRGISYLFSNLGGHGLCLWRAGDWNDAMDSCGVKGIGESVWLSEAAVKAGGEFAEIAALIGRDDIARETLEKTEMLKGNILRYGVDDGMFIYGINDEGKRVGAKDGDGQIFLNPQTWAVISGISDGEEAAELIDRAESILGCPYGYVQNSPGYSVPDDSIGRITYFEKGLYENGSVYNHGVAFKSVADCMIGDGSRALDTLKLILPSNKETAGSGAEPYAIPNMYFGPENPCRSGDAPQGWITGTSGWVFRCVTEHILGVKACLDGLRIDPVMPDPWDEAKMTRVWRNTRYEITIKNKNKNGVYKVTMDGQPIDGNVLRDPDGGVHEVLCER